MPAVINKEENNIIVRISGDVDHHLSKELRIDVDKEITETKPECVIFDLTECDFMDSSGLGLILGRVRKTQECGCKFKLVNPNAKTLRILKMAGVEKMINIETLSM